MVVLETSSELSGSNPLLTYHTVLPTSVAFGVWCCRLSGGKVSNDGILASVYSNRKLACACVIVSYSLKVSCGVTVQYKRWPVASCSLRGLFPELPLNLPSGEMQLGWESTPDRVSCILLARL